MTAFFHIRVVVSSSLVASAKPVLYDLGVRPHLLHDVQMPLGELAQILHLIHGGQEELHVRFARRVHGPTGDGTSRHARYGVEHGLVEVRCDGAATGQLDGGRAPQAFLRFVVDADLLFGRGGQVRVVDGVGPQFLPEIELCHLVAIKFARNPWVHHLLDLWLAQA